MQDVSPDALLRLYDGTFFLLARDYPELQRQRGPAVRWKTKPDARLMLMMAPGEMKDTRLTDLLKRIVQALEIPFEYCGFGMVQAPLQAADLAEMPTQRGVLFGRQYYPGAEGLVQEEDKQLYVVPALYEMIDNKANKKLAWQALETLKNDLAN